MVKIYGIDLGTTYSVIATLDEQGMPQIIENQDEGTPTLASAVYFQSNGDPVVGEVAKTQATVEPERVVQFVKREIGKPDAKDREFDGVKYGPIEISALILKRMKEYAKDQGHDVMNVVITCPAYFGNNERIATRQAGIMAGFNVLNIVNEPTAAALNYCCREFQENRKIMVFDLGGGTFDITLFDFSVDDTGKATIDVIDTGGDDKLGGIDWDDRLYGYISERYCDENGFTVDQIDNKLRASIKMQIEATKKLLSKKTTHGFTITYAGDVTRIEVSREKFEELTKDLVLLTMNFVRQLLSENSLSPDNIDLVLLVGGSTLMPMIKTAVEDLFPSKVRVEEPNLAVAKGAALAAAHEWIERFLDPHPDPFIIPQDEKGNEKTVTEEEKKQAYALMLTSNYKKISAVKDKLTRSFGPAIFIDDSHYMIDNLLFVGDEMPSESTGNYCTMADNQAAVEITVFENVSRDRVNKYITPSIDENGNEKDTDPALKVNSIGKLRLQLPAGTPKGSPIEVFFRCSAIGLEVRAINLETHESVEAVITSITNKTQEELIEGTKKMAFVKTRSDV